MAFHCVFMIFDGFGCFLCLFHGGFMLFMVLDWLLWFFKVFSWYFMTFSWFSWFSRWFLVGYGFSRWFLVGLHVFLKVISWFHILYRRCLYLMLRKPENVPIRTYKGAIIQSRPASRRPRIILNDSRGPQVPPQTNLSVKR